MAETPLYQYCPQTADQQTLNYQQNQLANSQNYYVNGYSPQFPNIGMYNYYNATPVNASYMMNTTNGDYRNGFVPLNQYMNSSITSLENPMNTSFNSHSFIPSSYPYNSDSSQLLNVNYFSNGLPGVMNININNNYLQSTSNSHYGTLNDPLNNSSNNFNTEQTYGYLTNTSSSATEPQNSYNKPHSSNQYKSNTKSQDDNVKKEPEKDSWFDMTTQFLNAPKNKNHSSTPKQNNKTSKSHNDLKNSSHSKSPKRRLNSNNNRNLKITEELFNEMNKCSDMSIDQIIDYENKKIYHQSPANLYYKYLENSSVAVGTQLTLNLCDEFENILGKRFLKTNVLKTNHNSPHKNNICKHKYKCSADNDSDDSSQSDDSTSTLQEPIRKMEHPDRLHPELWFNDFGYTNDGPMCKCSIKSQRSGIRHNIYVGEKPFKPCVSNSNNVDKLYHYRITITPSTNFLLKCPTIIEHDNEKYIFEGFSLISHYPIPTLPTCKVIRFNTNYSILYIEDNTVYNYTVKELQLFYNYLFRDILELVDLDFHAINNKDGCPQFHFMPRFVNYLPNNTKEILSMCEVLKYLLNNNKLLFEENSLSNLKSIPANEFQDIIDKFKGTIVTNPKTKPFSIRVDQIDRDSFRENCESQDNDGYPVIVHFGIRPPQLSYAGNPDYQKGWRDYVKFRHLLSNMPKPSMEDKQKLELKERALQKMRSHNKMKRGVTGAVSSKGFYRTGLMCDIVQHAMLIPVLVCHFRFHKSLEYLEESIGYKFKNKFLLQIALTHPSYKEHFGTNPDHARNTLTNCGIRQPEYGDRRIHYMNTRKRGINTLINIMSRFGKKSEMESNIMHNERLEFLGDAVVEFVTSIHLFSMFPDIEEGGLATFRASIVQNQHLAVLAKVLKLDNYMLYAHGSDLCHESELKHAMANCFEALMGALFLDGGIEVADRIFGETFYKDSPDLLDVWVNYPKHPLQQQEPDGDRKWIKTQPLLKKLTKLEDSIGVKFTHIRLLARAVTDRSVGFTNLTLGSNQRLEFLGDTVLQLIASDYLYKYFPEHHEGHLSLLRSSLVNNRTQSVVCDDLGLVNYALYANPKAELKTKDRADLLEAFLGALYIDKGLEHCQVFCNVCFFPRLHDFILNQDWNDPKSKLQQCCLTLRSADGGEPDIPVYKVIECMGPTNGRKYTVAVYFKGVRLSQANGLSIQQAEMNAANSALEVSKDLFPQLDHQRRAISRSLKHQCLNGQTNTDELIQIIEQSVSKNESNMSELELTKRKLHTKLLAVLFTNKMDDDDDDNKTIEEPRRKKKKCL